MCSLHKSTTHSDADCRTQHGVGSANAGSANYDGSYINQAISFTEREEPTEEELFGPFGPTDELVENTGLFVSIGRFRGAGTDDSLFMVEEEPALQLRCREHIVGDLTALTSALVIVALSPLSAALV